MKTNIKQDGIYQFTSITKLFKLKKHDLITCVEFLDIRNSNSSKIYVRFFNITQNIKQQVYPLSFSYFEEGHEKSNKDKIIITEQNFYDYFKLIC